MKSARMFMLLHKVDINGSRENRSNDVFLQARLQLLVSDELIAISFPIGNWNLSRFDEGCIFICGNECSIVSDKSTIILIIILTYSLCIFCNSGQSESMNQVKLKLLSAKMVLPTITVFNVRHDCGKKLRHAVITQADMISREVK